MPKSRAYTTSGKAWSDTYLTDPALVKALGPFSIDPCCPPDMPWATAKVMLTKEQDGLKTPWRKGRAWMNPPYRDNLPWALRFVAHRNGICLLNGRSTQTKTTQVILKNCAGVFLPDKRLAFYKVDGTAWDGKWFNNILIGMTAEDARLLSELPGRGFGGAFLLGPMLAGGGAQP